MEQPSSSLDEWVDQGVKATEEFERAIEKNAILIHKVFAQSDAGKELLQKFKEDLIMVPTLSPHSTQFEAGMNEGMKQFVRNIITQINTVESNQ